MAALKIGSLNCQGQSKMTVSKQLWIQHLLRLYNFDILCCQETFLEDDTFINCDFVMNNFTIIRNNAQNE